MPRVKRISIKDADLSGFPNFSATGSVKGMKKLYYNSDALLVRQGAYIYNVTTSPEIYYYQAH